MNRLEGHVKKGWGYELIWATNDKYCGKIMVFEKVGAKFSMHFHHEKDGTVSTEANKNLQELYMRIMYKNFEVKDNKIVT